MQDEIYVLSVTIQYPAKCNNPLYQKFTSNNKSFRIGIFHLVLTCKVATIYGYVCQLFCLPCNGYVFEKENLCSKFDGRGSEMLLTTTIDYRKVSSALTKTLDKKDIEK